jgi:hypothetical protein
LRSVTKSLRRCGVDTAPYDEEGYAICPRRRSRRKEQRVSRLAACVARREVRA